MGTSGLGVLFKSWLIFLIKKIKIKIRKEKKKLKNACHFLDL